MSICLGLHREKERQTVHKTFEIPLDIPDVTIEKTETKRHGDIIITVQSTIEGTSCHQCGNRITKVYGYDREIIFRHLPILGKKTFIRLRPVRYQCPSCPGKPTTTQQLSWYHPRSSYTKAYEEYILLLLVNSTIHDVFLKEQVGYEAITGMIDRHIQSEIDWDTLSRLDIIGIDEIALKKGHRDFVTILTGRMNKKTIILGVLADRKKATVTLFLSHIPHKLRETVQAVCSDMYAGFIYAVKEVFGTKVKIIIDRFHVAKLYRKGLDTLRKQELRRLKHALSEEAYKPLHGVMWILRKTEDDLTAEDKATLEMLFVYSPQLKVSYVLCKALTETFELHMTKRKAKYALKSWIKQVRTSTVSCFDTFIKTLEHWLDEIANYFLDRQTSGFVEGLNNKIKVIKRRCYGILHVKHLFQRIYLDLSGYALFS
jgi:transposase